MTNEEQQETIHSALAGALREIGLLSDDAILTGFCVAFEYRESNDTPTAGQLYGPATLTCWNALGLLEWARHCIYEPDDD